jgi:hypothetical protein
MDNVIDFPIDSSTACRHQHYRWRDIELSVCAEDASTIWTEDGHEIDGAQAMAILFGDFDLSGCLDGVGSPGAAVLVYEPGRRGRARMEAFPANLWIEAMPGLWFTHDGHLLLLSPSDPQLAANLTR